MNAASAGAENTAETKLTAPIITPQMKIVLDYLKEYGEMRDEDLQELLHIKKDQSLPADPPDERGRADRGCRQRGGENV